MEDKLISATTELKESTLDIAQQIVSENDLSKVKDLTQLFNAAHIKKQVLRSLAYDDLLDHIQDQMTARIVERGDQFSNKDLLDYANSVTSHLEKAQKQISGVDDMPLIQFNQQNNTIITETLDPESQQRVEDAIKSILQRIKEPQKENEVLESSTVYNYDYGPEEFAEPINIEFKEEGDN